MTSFYSEEELAELGLKSYGEDVLISRKCSIYGAANIELGNHVRIDDFCILSGAITIGDYVHISAYTALYAGESHITIEDYVAVSSRIAIYAESDDYTGEAMTNPMVPEEYRKVISGDVSIGRHSIIGSGCTILPNVTIGIGVAVGSMSLINKDLEPYTMYVGIPCRKLKARKKVFLEYEKYIQK